jgi:gentisate 1,2-dioxygenase
MSADDWKVYRLPDLLEKSDGMTSPYLEFLRVPTLSCGIYRLPAGATDMQGPHDEDEVYFVVSGRARLRVEGREERVEPGCILYVRATSEHSFFEIEEDVTLLVFFASGGPG